MKHVLSVGAILFVVTTWAVRIVVGISAENYNAELSLADDASTPEKKSEYLGRYIEKLKSDKTLPEHAAFIWKNERNRIASQIEVLASLQRRCDDLAPLDKESMGYAQGMTQITGQEFEHAVDHVAAIIAKGYSMSHFGWFWMYAPTWSWMALIFPLIAYAKHLPTK